MRGGLFLALALASLVVGLACGGGGDPTGEVTPNPDATPQVFRPPSDVVFHPPFEGPDRTFPFQERTNFRELAEYQLPDPATLPPGPVDGALEFAPPEEPECPDGWEVLLRPVERFQICYPPDWFIDGHGYVSAGADDRWYSVGIFRFGPDERERAHVSIYMTSPFAQPFLYVANCDQAYAVTLDGQAATLCPDHPGQTPEAKIIAYHVRQEERDYFINAVPILDYDEEDESYHDSWSEEFEETAIMIAQTFRFVEPRGE